MLQLPPALAGGKKSKQTLALAKQYQKQIKFYTQSGLSSSNESPLCTF